MSPEAGGRETSGLFVSETRAADAWKRMQAEGKRFGWRWIVAAASDD